MRRLFLLVLVLALGLTACAAASAESTGAAAAPQADPSIHGLDDAIDRYKAERYAEAAWGFSEVVAGRLPGDPQVAAFWLGKAYYRLDDHRRAAAIFAAIAAAPEHPSRLLNLAWLVQLRTIDPADRELLRAIGAYDLEVIEHPDFVFVVDELRVAFAAHRSAVSGRSRRRLCSPSSCVSWTDTSTRRSTRVASPRGSCGCCGGAWRRILHSAGRARVRWRRSCAWRCGSGLRRSMLRAAGPRPCHGSRRERILGGCASRPSTTRPSTPSSSSTRRPAAARSGARSPSSAGWPGGCRRSSTR